MALLEQAGPEERELLELPVEQMPRGGRRGAAEEMPPEAARRINATEESMLWSAWSDGAEESMLWSARSNEAGEAELESAWSNRAEETALESTRNNGAEKATLGFTWRTGTEEKPVAQAERRAAAESGGRSPAGDMVETLLESVTAGKAWEMWNRSGGAVRIGNGTREQMKLRYDGGEGAAALYGRVAAGQLRSTVEQRSGRVTVEMSEPVSVVSTGIRELDRAFQKDARRYDGGLSLL